MTIHCVGLNHRSAPLDLLERAFKSGPEAQATLAGSALFRGGPNEAAREAALLSTCNRVELYTVSPAAKEEQADLFADALGLPAADLLPHLYQFEDRVAVEHLMRVAAGLDSMVLGEPQILGQVAQAQRIAERAGTIGPVLDAALSSAVSAGKRARSETAIAVNPTTISSVAVGFASNIVRTLSDSQVIVVGAGEMAELAVEALRARGASQVIVVNRTKEKAAALADRWQAEVRPIDRLVETLAEADIAITATGSSQPLITTALVHQAMAKRPTRPLVLLDTAVPRDVESGVASLPRVHLYDLEALQQHLSGSLNDRQQEVPAVEAIIEAELEEFDRALAALQVQPIIAALHQRAEHIRQRELERTLSQLDGDAAENAERLQALTQAIVSKILHGPISQLKAKSQNGRATDYAQLVAELFELDPPHEWPGTKQEPPL